MQCVYRGAACDCIRVAAEQRSRLGDADAAEGEGWLDAAQRALDDAAERRLQQLYRDYQDDINNYELLQKGERRHSLHRTHLATPSTDKLNS